VLGPPLARALDRRVDAVVAALDKRLGRRGAVTLHDRLDVVDERADRILAALGERGGGRGPRLSELDAAAAAFLNRATGPEGYAAQAGLWFNPPVPVEHRAGAVEVLHVNERIVEVPFVVRATAGCHRVLDLGGGESTVGLSLASLGHEVTVVDPRGLALEHPLLTVLAGTVDELDAGEFDAAVALSTVEHVGLEAYGLLPGPADADRGTLDGAFERVRPGGRLVLTVPYAPRAARSAFQRVYDAPALAGLLGRWERPEVTYARRLDRHTWVAERDAGAIGPGDEAVALVVAHRP
jgi:hypothetical protein